MRISLTAVGAVLTLSLFGCGGGGGSGSLPAPQSAPATQPGKAEALWDKSHPLQTTPTPAASDRLYVGNLGNNSITVYQHDAKGNTAPIAIIYGSKTGINSPGQLSGDAQGNLYVANGSVLHRSANPAILVFAHGANGNVAPIRKIAGPATGIQFPTGLTVDKATGKIFVNSEFFAEDGVSTLIRFPSYATGNQTPYAKSAGLAPVTQLASDSTDQNIVESSWYFCCSSVLVGTRTFQKQFTNGATLQELYSVYALSTYGIADDPTTATYLVSTNSGIYRFAENTNGHGDVPDGPSTAYAPPPVSIITNDTCGGQLATPPGLTPYTYVLHGTENGCPADAVYVYSHDASGKATPVRILSGPATQMSQPYGLYEGH
jgi:hypothetical protein